MRFSRLAIGFCLVLCSLAAFSQDQSKVQVFGGYSLLHVGSGGIDQAVLDSISPAGTFNLKSNFSGWNGEFQYNINNWVGAVADVSGNYGTRLIPTSLSGIAQPPNGRSYTFMVGPVVQQSEGKLRPFAHFLLGFNRETSDLASTVDSVFLTGSPTAATNLTDTAFALAFGGGLDWKAGRNVAVRLGQLDYIYTRHDYSTVSNDLGLDNDLTHQNSLRYSAGLVFNFGK
jgi:opacity protein-like surface antigen